MKDQNHVLATGKVAEKIWRRAAIQVGMPFDPQKSWKEKIEAWFRCAARSSQKGCLIGLMPSILTWSLWLWRCKVRMEGKENSVESL